MNKGFSILRTIYPIDVHVFYGETQLAVEFFKQFLEESYYKELEDFVNGNYIARVNRVPKNKILVHFTEDAAPMRGIVAHECFHIVEYVFEHIGLKHSSKSSEAYSYYLQYLVNKVYEGIENV